MAPSESGGGYRVCRRQLYRLVLLVLFAAANFAPVWAAQSRSSNAKKNPPAIVPTSITDLQVKQTAAREYAVRVQSDGPLAFDRVKSANARQILVRFYNAQVGALPSLDAPPFGTLSWSIGSRGEVTLIVDLAHSSTRASVAQGGNPNVVEIRLRD